MKSISFITPDLRRLESTSASVLVLYRFSEMRPLSGINSLVDWRLCGHLSRLIIDGFFLGETDESLLMPLGKQLPQEYLLIFGLGNRAAFSNEVFYQSTIKMFNTVQSLNKRDIVLALPGRVERECDTTQGIEWFLDCYEKHGRDQDIRIVETISVQKAMMPVVERWRLRQLMP
ncbi:MAG: hypothetical protein GY847_05865 [Proteobacteria bacterium]|nr:hypothetical protein [Pseudomonadota bacterium]